MLRTIVPRVALFAVGATMLVVGNAMVLDPSAHSWAVPAERTLDGPPVWTAADATAHPDCVPSAAWPSGTPAGFVVVHSFRDQRHVKIAFDRAWALNHDDTEADDVWVLGVCP